MRFSGALVFFLLPAVAFAAGGHDDLDCTGCHSLHDARADQLIFANEPNLEAVNPRTGSSYSGVTALCLSCHEETGGMGILPVFGDHSHPFSVVPDPKAASVPPELLRDDQLECVSCHDPHPSNPNYQYLRASTVSGSQMKNFCSVCHPAKSGIRTAPSELFSSMDERQRVAAVAAGSTAAATE